MPHSPSLDYTAGLSPLYWESHQSLLFHSGSVSHDASMCVPRYLTIAQAYDTSKSLIYALTPNRTSKEFSVAEYATAGFLSAIPTTLVTAPVERAKVILQVQGQGTGGTHYNGVFDVVKHLYAEGGIRSVYRGSVATVARDGPGSAAYFAAYEIVKRMLTPAGSKDLNLGAVIFAGGMAGVAMWSIAIPPDVRYPATSDAAVQRLR